MMRGKREKALLSAACLAVALLFAACEGELAPSGTGGAASAASAVSAAQQSAPAGESPGGSPFPEGGVQQEDGVSFGWNLTPCSRTAVIFPSPIRSWRATLTPV